ncbi:hypothetical protein B0H13DRAFT_1090897 [Mycena leptocephala]|nr:hypothetical protein B0H13DRAFT_1090897 [Mycena leptocephala]
MLLQSIFRGEEGFIVEAQTQRDFVLIWIVSALVATHRKPVFLLEVNPRDTLTGQPSRCAVDSEIRDCLEKYFPRCRGMPSRLHAISAFGGQVCFYEKTQENLLPRLQSGSQSVPRQWWAKNIMEDVEAVDKLFAIVEEIKIQVRSFHPNWLLSSRMKPRIMPRAMVTTKRRKIESLFLPLSIRQRISRGSTYT